MKRKLKKLLQRERQEADQGPHVPGVLFKLRIFLPLFCPSVILCLGPSADSTDKEEMYVIRSVFKGFALKCIKN